MLRISEVLANPTGTDKGAEYVVIKNTDGAAISVSGYKIKNGGGKTIPVSGTIAPHGELKVMTGGVALKNTGDTLILLNPAGAQIDSFTYTTAADGVALQPAAFLTAEMKAELFEELATTSPAAGPLSGGAPASGGQVLIAIVSAAILALLAVWVVKQVKYDEIVNSPFAK